MTTGKDSVNRRLIIFTRFPLAGVTKTRLIPVLGAAGAARLQRQMTEHVLRRVRQVQSLPALRIEIRFAGGDTDRMQAWLGAGCDYRPQGSGNLGDRMASAFTSAFNEGVDQSVLIGSDIPGITGTTIEHAYAGLDQADVVCGPSRDGGYYLIGMHRQAFAAGRILFQELSWGTATVLDKTLQMAAAAGLQTCLLEELTDVDFPEDLPIWEKEKLALKNS